MNKLKAPIILLALVATLGMTDVDAHGHRGSWGGCGSLRSPPRRYNYNRRPRDAIDLVSEGLSTPFYSNVNSLFRQLSGQSGPRYSIEETEDSIELSMEVPGVAAKDLTVEVVDDTVLRIRGSRSVRESGSYTQSEFDQSFQLDDTDMDVDNIQVTLSNGILKIVAPKKVAKVTSKSIPITVEDGEESEQLTVSVAAQKEQQDTIKRKKNDSVVKTKKEKEEARDEDEEEDSWQ
jgi:HSP20 family protein